MFYYLSYFLQNSSYPWLQKYSIFFTYTSVRASVAFLLTFLIFIVFGKKFIGKLISMKLKQPIRLEELHELFKDHNKKSGTPTMGGLLILVAVICAFLLCCCYTNPFVLAVLFVFLGYGGIGFLDDYQKIAHNNSAGISSKMKLLLQTTIAAVAVGFIYFSPTVQGNASSSQQKAAVTTIQQQQKTTTANGYRWIWQKNIPDQNQPLGYSMITPLQKEPLLYLGIFFIPFAILVLVGSSNAVNLTDGLDGLAAGCSIVAFSAYGLISYLAGHYLFGYEYLHLVFHSQLAELSVLIAAIIGACFGFLWFNVNPAKVFMGDTGSLALGGALGMTAICVKQELLLIIIGFVFVMEATSVILQVLIFKRTGKRLFKMAPIHHHFEIKGWHENQIVTRFWMIAVGCAVIGVFLLKVI